MDTKIVPISVYAEMTPNPATMKFVANKILVEDGAVLEFTEMDNAESSPLASKLLNFPFVSSVFLTGNFVSVTRNNLVEWEDVTLEVREFITEYIKAGKPVTKGDIGPAKGKNPQSEKETFGEVKPVNETEKRIVDILEEYIRPAVQQDGGAIHFHSYKEGVLTVVLKGACSGCPSSMVTLKGGIEGLFRQMLPEVKEVVAKEM